MLRILTTALFAATTCLAAWPAAAQYPDRPIHLVVAFPPGGPPDLLARMLAPAMTEELRQNVVVENRSGASGMIGTQAVSRATPDGYTIMVGSIATHATNAATFKSLPYDPQAGFTPIALLAESPIVLVANPGFPASSVSQLVELAKKGPLNYGSNSTGSTAHLSAELLQLRTQTKMNHVPYRGSSPFLTDLMGGHIMVGFDNLPAAIPYVRTGQLKVLAVTSAQRSPLLPNTPTLGEEGITGYSASAWYGIFGPPGLPAGVVATLSKAISASLKKAAVQTSLRDFGFITLDGGPDALAAKVSSELKIWRNVVDTNNIEKQ